MALRSAISRSASGTTRAAQRRRPSTRSPIGGSTDKVHRAERPQTERSIASYTIINAARRLGIEFVLDVAPASRKPALGTARVRKHGAIAQDDVSVVAASSV